MTALLRATLLFHPRMAPPSVSNRKIELSVTPPLVIGKPLPLTNTVPVGPSDGILTTSRFGAPVFGSYRVERFVPLSDTHIGLPGAWEIPHGFTRLGSVWAATPFWSATRGTI